MSCPELSNDIDIDNPRYDQNLYIGRLRHFLVTTFPTHFFASTSALENAKSIVEKYRKKDKLCITEDELWAAKNLYSSAYHPDTGELMIAPGRMCSQVPLNMFICGGMLTFYKHPAPVFFFQWLNQSYNALVNYTNRSGQANVTDKDILICYVAATFGAVGTSLGLNMTVSKFPPLIGRFVPFAAICVANMINIPLMRSHELTNGITVTDRYGKEMGQSKHAAIEAIIQVIFSRIMMSVPGFVLIPIVMDKLERRGTLCRYPWLPFPTQAVLVGFAYAFAVPVTCAIFKQQASIPSARVEEELRKKLGSNAPSNLYYNKGL